MAVNKRFRSSIPAVFLAVVLISAASITPAFDRLNAYSIDLLFMARNVVYGQQYPPEQSKVVVVALDEQTYDTEPFSGLPKVLWTPYIAAVQDQILAAGATVIGYDLIFSTSLESYLPGHERPFLLSLLKGSRQDKVVLGKAQHAEKPVAPHPSQGLIVNARENVRSLNMHADGDDIIRRIPLIFTTADQRQEPSMALEVAARAVKADPQRRPDGQVMLNNYRIPGGERNAALINFQGGDDIPTYSLADLYACSQQGGQDYFRRHFKDKVVLLAAVLDVEDRKTTSKRFMTGSGLGAEVPECQIPRVAAKQTFRRDTIPGVFVHATAINNLLRQDLVEEPGIEFNRTIIILLALISAVLTALLKPSHSTAVVTSLLVASGGVGVVALQQGWLLPVLPAITAMLVSYLLISIYRYMIVDKQKKKIRNLFSLYLQPHLVDRMVETDHLPQLGGEEREVSVLFSDLANFTELSEGLDAHELVSLMNRYFTAATELIESHGGFVDKYIGDAVVAVFGAPLDDPHHAGHAVAAALMIRDKLQQMNEAGEFGERKIELRTGINSGVAVVGNVGSSKRFNYTVMGDTVNLASRLEGANKTTKTRILISDEVVARLPDSFVVREVATIRVKGKQTPTTVFEPMAAFSNRPARREEDHSAFTKLRQKVSLPKALQGYRKLSADFARAQDYYHHRQFAKAIALMQPYGDDAAAQALLQRATDKLHHPPPEDWDGVDILKDK